MSETLTLAIIGHLVGDYLLQTDWMALNKKQRTWPCVVHCFLWTVSVMLFSGWGTGGGLLWSLLWPTSRLKLIAIFAFLFVTHFIQDRTQIVGWWMRLKWKDQSGFATAPLAPWSLIVVDNVWHIVALFALWKIIPYL